MRWGRNPPPFLYFFIPKERKNVYNAPMIDFRQVKFITSAPTVNEKPKEIYPEVIFLGKSNVGKSTLINSLVDQKIAFSSKKAGKTKLLNYFLVDKKFYLVDAPGYGYTAYGSKEDENFGTMMEGYFSSEEIKVACLLVDVRRQFSEDEKGLLKYIKELGIPFIIVYTKCDNAKQSELAAAKLESQKRNFQNVYFSGKNSDIKLLRSLIANLIK
jgi:GTP-binding protein